MDYEQVAPNPAWKQLIIAVGLFNADYSDEQLFLLYNALRTDPVVAQRATALRVLWDNAPKRVAARRAQPDLSKIKANDEEAWKKAFETFDDKLYVPREDFAYTVVQHMTEREKDDLVSRIKAKYGSRAHGQQVRG